MSSVIELAPLQEGRMPSAVECLRGLIDSRVQKCWANSALGTWDEDHITLSVLEEIANAAGEPWMSYLDGKRISWRFRKQTGRSEFELGDIGVIVTFVFPDGSSLAGAGFLEAKRTYPNGNGFEALSNDQLMRHLKVYSHHRVLLWDHQPPHASSILTWKVLADGRRTVDLYRNGCDHFAVTLLSRYIEGSELSLQKDLPERIRSGGTRHVIEAVVTQDDDREEREGATSPSQPLPSEETGYDHGLSIEEVNRRSRCSKIHGAVGVSAAWSIRPGPACRLAPFGGKTN